MSPTDAFPLTDEMAQAGDQASRARILLRASDEIVLSRSTVLADACRHHGFEAGADFIDIRVAALLAVRSPAGHLPDSAAALLGCWRMHMVGIARRTGQ